MQYVYDQIYAGWYDVGDTMMFEFGFCHIMFMILIYWSELLHLMYSSSYVNSKAIKFYWEWTNGHKMSSFRFCHDYNFPFDINTTNFIAKKHSCKSAFKHWHLNQNRNNFVWNYNPDPKATFGLNTINIL